MDILFRWGKMHYMQKALFVLLSMVLVACGEKEKVNLPDEPETPGATITLAEGTDTNPLLDTSGGTVTLHFTATADWKATVGNIRAVGWITISPASGKAGEASVTISVAANNGTDERSASVFLECGDTRETIVVSQKQKDALIVSQQNYELSAGEADIEVEVEANVTFEVEVSDTWIEQISTRSLEKSVLAFRILANDGYNKRSGSIVINSGELRETVHIYQEGREKEVLLLSDDLVEVGAGGGTVDVQLQSSVSYICKPEAEYTWVSEPASRAVSTHTLHFEVQPNDTYDEREARFIFVNETESVSDTLTIRQYAVNEILVPSEPVVCEADAGTFSIEINTNISYDVKTDVDWLKQVASRGLKQFTLYFSVEENTETAMREGNIIVTGNGVERTVKVLQKGKEEAPYLFVSQDYFDVQAGGGTVRFTVKGNVPYRVSAGADWMTRTLSGDAEEEIVFTILPNESTASREATITVTSEDGSLVRTVRVVQEGKEELILNVSPSSFSLTNDSQTLTLSVETNTRYRLSSSAFWLSSNMTGVGEWKNPTFTVSANESTASREATITVTSEDGSLVRTVHVVQEGREELILNVSPSSFSLTNDSQTLTLSVETNTRYRLSSSAFWLSSNMTGVGEWKNPTFTVSANESTTSREATITVTSEDGSLIRTVRVVQEGEAVYLEVSPSSISAASEGGRFAFTVNSNTQYTLTSSDTGWINIEENIIVVAANTSTSQRKGSVTVRAEELVRVIEITQDGKKEETPSAGGSTEDFTENEEDW